MFSSVILGEFFVLCHSEGAGRPKNLAEVEHSEILRGVYPEPDTFFDRLRMSERKSLMKTAKGSELHVEGHVFRTHPKMGGFLGI